MSKSLDRAAKLVDLPKDAIPTGGITIVGYLGPEGEQLFGMKLHGDPLYSSVLGLMSMAAFHINVVANPPGEDS